MNIIIKAIKKSRNILPEKIRFFMLYLCSKALNISFQKAYYNSYGIANFGNYLNTGEEYLITRIIKTYLEKYKIDQPVLFDVGANTGNYTKMLTENIPNAQIYSFEPNPFAFSKLPSPTKNKQINYYNFGLGSEIKIAELYLPQEEKDAEIATMQKSVLSEVFKKNIFQCNISIKTLDSFCQANHIEKIHFLKIDVEGSEYDVLKGATNLINSNSINIIQFEFNEMNIYSKVFLKDFYDILNEYYLYRLNKKKLININSYLTEYEVFKFQNIVAFNKKCFTLNCKKLPEIKI